MTESWIQTDEAEDVAGSVRHALRSADFVGDDPQAWKWVALSLHAALQGACICHLTTTAAPVGAVTSRNAAEWLAYFESQRAGTVEAMPKTYLMGLYDLLRAVRKPYSAGDRSNDDGIPISDSELAWLRRFHNSVRNQFVHFEPKGWSLEVSGIPELAELIARLIKDIMDKRWAFRHQDQEWHAALSADLAKLRSWTTLRGPAE